MLQTNVSRLLIPLLLAIGSCANLPTTYARQLEPITDSAAKSKDPVADAKPSDISSIYKLTKSARTASDYSQIIDQCQIKLADDLISDKDRKYLKSLMSWALNRRGDKQLSAAEVLLSVGNRVEWQNNMDRAIADFEASFESDPTRWRALMGRANAHVMHGEYEPAIAIYTKIQKLNPKQNAALFNRAELNFTLKDFDAALVDYDRIIHDDQTDVQAITGRGLCYFATGEYERAAAEFRSVVRLLPANAAARCNLGDALQRIGKFSDAHQQYVLAAGFADPGIACERIARLLASGPTQQMHQPKTAIDWANRAIEVDGQTPRNLETLAVALEANGDSKLADQTKRRAKKLLEQMDAGKSAVRVASDPNPNRR